MAWGVLVMKPARDCLQTGMLRGPPIGKFVRLFPITQFGYRTVEPLADDLRCRVAFHGGPIWPVSGMVCWDSGWLPIREG